MDGRKKSEEVFIQNYDYTAFSHHKTDSGCLNDLVLHEERESFIILLQCGYVYGLIAQQKQHSVNLKALLSHYAKADSKKEEVIKPICILHLELNEALF